MHMPEKSIHSALRDTFPPANKEIWKKIASQEIDKKDPFENLLWGNSDDVKFFPYYDSNDVASLNYLDHFQSRISEKSFLGPRHWINAPQVVVKKVSDANSLALDHLANGADGIFFKIKNDTDVNILLNSIEWPYCSLFFQSVDSNFVANQLQSFLKKNTLPLDELNGALFWDTRPKKDDLTFYFDKIDKVKSLGITIAPSTPIQEISSGLLQAVSIVEQLRADGYTFEKIINAIAFSINVETHFLDTIAKLKALRILWFQVAKAYGTQQYDPGDLLIHASSSPWINATFEPHGNLIKSTSAAMASIIGGADALTIIPQDENSVTQSRIARNVSSLLREESHFNKVADPVAGSYAIDTMVDTIARNAWSLFQSKIAS